MGAKGSSIVGTLIYFARFVVFVEGGCLNWSGTLNRDGYGRIVIGYRGPGKPIRRYAHRVAYETWIGTIPDGYDLDHLCRNRRCVNVAHLEPVTRKENVRRGVLSALMSDLAFRPRRHLVAVCKNGHAMVGENIGTSHTQSRRWCRTCKRDTQERLRRSHEKS